jgi:hypothetical protein
MIQTREDDLMTSEAETRFLKEFGPPPWLIDFRKPLVCAN